MKFVWLLLFIVVLGCTKSGDPKFYFDKGDYQLWLAEAETGNAEAKNYLGIHHYLGLGTPRDYHKAKEWFEQAAHSGWADAQYNLGTMYENGEAVAINYMTAYMWLYAAHRNGNSHAANRMWGITGDHKLFGNQVARAEELAEPYINR